MKLPFIMSKAERINRRPLLTKMFMCISHTCLGGKDRRFYKPGALLCLILLLLYCREEAIGFFKASRRPGQVWKPLTYLNLSFFFFSKQIFHTYRVADAGFIRQVPPSRCCG